MQLTYSKSAHPYRVHELKNIPNLTNPSAYERLTYRKRLQTAPSSLHGEAGLGGEDLDIYPDRAGVYTVLDDEHFLVQAAAVRHSVPCVGYSVVEKDKVGRLRIENIAPHVERNKAALQQQDGYGNYARVYGDLKRLLPGQSLVLPDGHVLEHSDALESDIRGRKLVVMGDCSDGGGMAPLAQDADLLVHEATNAYTEGSAHSSHPAYRALEDSAVLHGHSTPQMAGKFARQIRAKRLLLTHFSAKFSGDATESSMRVMWAIEDQARETSGLWGRNQVVAAWDFLSVPIKGHGTRK